MFCNLFETQRGRHSFYLATKTSLHFTSNSLDSIQGRPMWACFLSALTYTVASRALHNKLDLPESSALLFASLMSPPVSGMDELIADTSLSYAWLADAKIQMTLWQTAEQERYSFTNRNEWQNIIWSLGWNDTQKWNFNKRALYNSGIQSLFASTNTCGVIKHTILGGSLS